MEECDEGAANSDTVADACRTNCQLPSCGDSVVDTGYGEACDDGNIVNTDACVSNCQANVCGDGFVYSGTEECDAGAANSDTVPDACRTTCAREWFSRAAAASIWRTSSSGMRAVICVMTLQ